MQRGFPSDEVRERARATNLVERERKVDVVALFYTLSLGFAAGSDRSIQAFLERYGEKADCVGLSYAAFHGWFEPGFVALLREILDNALENLTAGRTNLSGRLEGFRDVLIVDVTAISLYRDAQDVYTLDEDRAGTNLHLTESLSTGLPTRFQTTDGKTHELSQLPTGEWVAGAVVLFDLGYCDFR
jgi:IS4 transposase